jgi:hypothetical protein
MKVCPAYFCVITTCCLFCLKVITEDIDGNGDLEVILQEVGGLVTCYDLPNGQLIWKKQLTGEVPLAMRVVDLENDLHLELLISTGDGLVFCIQQ